MASKALLTRLDARHGQENALEAFLTAALPEVQAERETTSWFAVRLGRGEYAIFDTFTHDAAREAHLNGPLAKGLVEKAGPLLSKPPLLQRADVLADKLTDNQTTVSKALLLTFRAPPGRAEDVAEFLRQARSMVLAEPKTTAWFAVHFESWAGEHGEFGIFDAFPDNGSRFHHLTGQVPRALAKHAFEYIGSMPELDLSNVLAAKLH